MRSSLQTTHPAQGMEHPSRSPKSIIYWADLGDAYKEEAVHNSLPWHLIQISSSSPLLR